MENKAKPSGNNQKQRTQYIKKPPVESVGSCRNAKNCGNWKKTYLGNGYCMKCWDKGLGGGVKIPAYKKKDKT